MQVHENKTFKNIVYSDKETKDREFEKCTFINCDLSNGIFTSSKFNDCVFTNCNLAMANLNKCQLNNVTFKDCKLIGVNFSNCIDFLFFVKFEGCVLDYCSFIKKKIPKTSFKNTSLKNADFTESDLTKSTFTNSDLLNAVFNRTILKEVNFLTALNYSIDPEINNIRKAKFSLYGVTGLLDKYDIIIE
jgi:fluoroquinolone resistance protein